jgi:hypothetical protein
MDPTAAIPLQPAPPPLPLPVEGDAPAEHFPDRVSETLQFPGGTVATTATLGGALGASWAALARAAPRGQPGHRRT